MEFNCVVNLELNSAPKSLDKLAIVNPMIPMNKRIAFAVLSAVRLLSGIAEIKEVKRSTITRQKRYPLRLAGM